MPDPINLPSNPTVIVVDDMEPANVMPANEQVNVYLGGTVIKAAKFKVGDIGCPQIGHTSFLLMDNSGKIITNHFILYVREKEILWPDDDFQYVKETGMISHEDFPFESLERVMILAFPIEQYQEYAFGQFVGNGFPYNFDMMFGLPIAEMNLGNQNVASLFGFPYSLQLILA